MATTTTTTTYSINNGSVTTTKTVKSNIYNDKGCDNIGSCANYSAWTKCLIDLYHGVSACQNVYILDENGQPIDLDRLDKIKILLFNEFGCAEMSTEYGVSVTNMQSKYDGDLFTITPDNFWDMEAKYFDLHNVKILDNTREICRDDIKAISLGGFRDECMEEGHIIFTPIEYSGDLSIELEMHESNVGNCIAMVNGLPQPLNNNKKTTLINVLNGCEQSIVSLMSVNSSFEPNQALIKRINFSCTKGYLNKGLIKVCYEADAIPYLTGQLTAEIMLLFNDKDDEHPGETKIIKCFPMVNVRQSMILNGVQPPIQEGRDNEVFTIVLVDKLPTASWNTMNKIYLIRSEHRSQENENIEYVTVKTKVNNGYSYHWERVGDNYDMTASQVGERSAAITLTNDDDTDTIILKHVDQKDGNGSMIAFTADGNTITANITNIDGGVL